MKFLSIILLGFMLISTNLSLAEETENKNTATIQIETNTTALPAEQTENTQPPIEFILKNSETTEVSTTEVADTTAASTPAASEPVTVAADTAPTTNEPVAETNATRQKAELQASLSPKATMLIPASGTSATSDADNDTWNLSDFENGLQLFSGKQAAPALTLTDMDGKTHDLQEYRGKTVLLNFWQTTCPSCVKEISSLENLQKRFSTDDFVVLSVDTGEDEESVATFLDNFPVGYPVLLDPDNSTLTSWKLRAYPSTFIIDREGYLRLAYFGGLEWDGQNIVDTLAAQMELAAK